MAIVSEKTSSSSNIPWEIIEIILSKLSSVKSLLRFKSVSKSWNTLISNPLFIQNHLESSNNSPDNNLFLCLGTYGTDRGFPLVKFEVGNIHSGEISVENIPNGYDSILCECNGVLLLSNRHDRCRSKYALWNPSTRSKVFLINRCEFNEDYEVDRRVGYYKISGHVLDCGVCYDKITGDFKVVFVFETKYSIYSCNNNSWTEKYLGTKFYTILGTPGAAIFVDGATYWILGVESRNRNISGTQLVYFDPRTDELKILKKPEQLSDDKFHLINKTSLRGSLCLYQYNYNENSIQIWIKEKGIEAGENSTSWKEFITVGKLRPFLWITPICFVGNKVVIQVERKKFVYYSPTEKTFEEFAEIDVNCNRFIRYRNSLYFPTGVKTTTIKAQQSRFMLPEHKYLCM